MFFYQKYEAGHVPAAWPVVGTCFSIQNIKPGMYLRPGPSQILVFPPKIWSQTCTWDLAGRRYLLSHPKSEAGHVPEAWPIAIILLPTHERRVPTTGTCFLTHNIKHNVYLPLVRVFPPKISSRACIYGMTGCRYLFYPPEYKARHVPEAWPVYLRFYFRFFDCKNCNAGAVLLTAG